MILFAPTTDQPFGIAVAHDLNIVLAEHEERDFEDGEHKIRPLTCVREEDVYVVQSLYGDNRQSVNDKLCRLLFFLGALRDAGAKRVTAVIPYLCYSRKDRKTKTRDPITSRYVAQLLESVGADRVLTMDVHNLAAFQNAFRIQTIHLEATSAFVSHFAKQSPRDGMTVVSPDAGGVKRAERFRQALSERLQCEVPMAMVEKHRSKGVVRGEMFAGDVEGRLAIVVDDLISTGGTLVRAARACRSRGAVTVYAAATHGLLVGDAGQLLAEDALQQVVLTNTVPAFRLKGTPAENNLTVLDVAPMFARAIRRMHEGGPIEGESLFE
ncbi:MAG: ribose-phosphate pyrophosphokinase [Candidatus Paceibacterota bacterium]